MGNVRVLMIDALVGNDYSLILCDALHKQGTDISLVVTEDRKLAGKETFVVKRWLPSKSQGKSRLAKTYKYFRYLIRLFFYIRKNADVVHFQFFRRKRIESIFFYLLGKSGVKLVYTVHDVTPLDENKTDRYFNNIVYKTADNLIVHSEPNRKMLMNMGINSDKISIIPHGNFDVFLSEDTINKQCAREKMNISQEADVILFFGFIKKYKGLDLLLDAFSIASAENKNLYLIIAGAAETEALNNHYLSRIFTIPSNNRIIYHNRFIEEKKVPLYFRASDLVVLPYKQISHSGVMHLAYSFGRPLLVTDTGDFAYTVEDDESGFVVYDYEADAMALKINEAFSNKTRLGEINNHILELNRTKYTWTNSAKLTESVYRNLVSN